MNTTYVEKEFEKGNPHEEGRYRIMTFNVQFFIINASNFSHNSIWTNYIVNTRDVIMEL